jgi:hypothetical protein
VKFAGKIIQIKSDSVRLMRHRGSLDHPGVEGEPPQQIELGGV